MSDRAQLSPSFSLYLGNPECWERGDRSLPEWELVRSGAGVWVVGAFQRPQSGVNSPVTRRGEFIPYFVQIHNFWGLLSQ